MNSRLLSVLWICAFAFLPLYAQSELKSFVFARIPDPISERQNRIVYGKLPLSFEANTGQADTRVTFYSRGGGYGLYLTGNEAVLALRMPVSGRGTLGFERKLRLTGQTAPSDVVMMRLVGVMGNAEPVGEEQLPGTANYFIGSDPAKWHTNIPTYAKVRYPAIYPGIDLIYYGHQQQLEYDFIVAPGADPKLIRLQFAGLKKLHLTTTGDLVVTTANESLIFHKPSVYQIVDGHRDLVPGDFALLARNTVRFRLGNYDHAKPLVIDPVLVYSTYLGGNSYDQANAIAVDSAGDVYVTGQTYSTDFPATPGAFQKTDQGGENAANVFIAKLNAAGSALVYSTYLGGSGNPSFGGGTPNAIAVDTAGDAYVTGSTHSTDFPVTQGAFQTTNKAAVNDDGNAFVAKLSPTGTSLIYSTYLGGSGAPLVGGDAASAITVDTTGDVYVTGSTYSTDFPVTQGAFQTTKKAASNEDGNAFVAKLNSAGTALVYSTYLGGSGGPSFGGDAASAITVDTAGDAYLTGSTYSTDFPVTQGAFQTTNKAVANRATNAFVAQLNQAGTALIYSTFLGGSNGDLGRAIVVDTAGNAYVGGGAASTDFPVTPRTFQMTNHFSFNGNSGSNAFIAKLNPTGSSLVYSTYLGGSGGAINLSPSQGVAAGDQVTGLAIDNSSDVYVTGSTASADFPVTQGAYQTMNNDQTKTSIGGYNAFVTELNPAGSSLIYSTYLGGNGNNPNDDVGAIVYGEGDQASALALDSSDNVYVTGSVSSNDFPVTGSAFQTTIHSRENAFVAKLDLSAISTAITPTVTVTPAATTIPSALPLTVTVAVSGNPAPTGTLTLASGTYSSGAITLTGGSATIDIPSGALVAEPAQYSSPDILSVNYIPGVASSSLYNFSSGEALAYVVAPYIDVTPAATTLTLTQALLQPISVSIVATGGSGLPTPSGTVILTAGSYVSAAATLTSGQATITIPAGTLTAGYDQVVADYAGDSNYLAYGGSNLVTVTPVGSDLIFWIDTTPISIPASATTGNTSDVLILPKSNQFAGTVSLNCSVTATPSNPTSPVTCSIPSSLNITSSSGGASAILTVNSTAATTLGDYVIVISGVWNGVTEKAVVDVAVTAAPPQAGFALANAGNITVNPGATTGNAATISVTPSNGFTGTVNLSCTVTTGLSNPTDPPTCSIPSSVTITGTAAVAATLTVTTTARRSAINRPLRLLLPSAGRTAIAFILLFGIPTRRKHWSKFFGLAMFVVLLPGLGCGGGGNIGLNSGNGGTTLGAYTVTVTGTDAATGKLTASTRVTVIVD